MAVEHGCGAVRHSHATVTPQPTRKHTEKEEFFCEIPLALAFPPGQVCVFLWQIRCPRFDGAPPLRATPDGWRAALVCAAFPGTREPFDPSAGSGQAPSTWLCQSSAQSSGQAFAQDRSRDDRHLHAVDGSNDEGDRIAHSDGGGYSGEEKGSADH